MKPLIVTKQIRATVDEVFEVVAHIEVASNILPKIQRAVILSDQKRGVGTRFVETRMMGKREFTMEFEVTEYDPPRSIRFHCVDQMDTTWDSVYELEETDGATTLILTLHYIPTKFSMKLMWPLMKWVVRKGAAEDLNNFANHLENQQH